MLSRLRISTCLLPVLLMVFACLPGDDQASPGAKAGETAADEQAGAVKLDFNDVSILLPPPTSAGDPVLPIDGIAFDGEPVWPDDVFAQFLAIANSEAGFVDTADTVNGLTGSRIDVSAFADKSVWHVASIRIDPGAPGLSPDIADAFGQTPQVRLVLQPVTEGRVVHDVAAHVIYSYTSGAEPPAQGCLLPRFQPDRERFARIVDDLRSMKSRLAAGEIGDAPIETDGLLSVHPAADPVNASGATRVAFRDALEAFLEDHLDPSKLRAMAIMALPGGRDPEPWIFLAMAPDPRSGQFAPLPSPALSQEKFRFAQMLDARQGLRNVTVSPAVSANNLNPITCRFEMPVDTTNEQGPKPPADPRGVSTVELFPNSDAERMRNVVSVIADPTRAHFFNTDCVSCHTETRREMDIADTDEIDAKVDPAVLPTELWNVRNFGWFPSFLQGGVFATATRRTATETEEVVDALNADFLGQ